MKLSHLIIAAIFAGMGVAIITIGWLRQLNPDQRTMITLAGAAGIIGAIIFIISRRQASPPR